jgi:hypothetical protein
MYNKISLLLVSIFLFLGCGHVGPKLYHISGEVTYDGKPVSEGVIYFTPNTATGDRASQGVAFIQDGKYDTSKGRGISSGSVSVIISGNQRLADKEETVPLFEDYIEEFEVPDQNTVKNFNVPINITKQQ